MKYINNGVSITLPLNNINYEIVVFIHYPKSEGSTYTADFYLNCPDIKLIDIIDEQTGIEFEGNKENIKNLIGNHVFKLFNEGFYKKYIDRYEYQLKCFDAGDEYFRNLDKEAE